MTRLNLLNKISTEFVYPMPSTTTARRERAILHDLIRTNAAPYYELFKGCKYTDTLA